MTDKYNATTDQTNGGRSRRRVKKGGRLSEKNNKQNKHVLSGSRREKQNSLSLKEFITHVICL